MSSAETDQRDRRERERQIDASLAADRQGRDRLRNLADTPASKPPPADTPNRGGGRDR